MITINGKTYRGNSREVNNNEVWIAGVKQHDKHDTDKQINITVTGNIDSLVVGHCTDIVVGGEVHTLKTKSGDVSCGNVKGNVQTGSGDVTCRDIEMSVQTGSGDVNCKGNIKGTVKTGSGDVYHS